MRLKMFHCLKLIAVVKIILISDDCNNCIMSLVVTTHPPVPPAGNVMIAVRGHTVITRGASHHGHMRLEPGQVLVSR